MVRRPKQPNRHLRINLLEIGFGRGEDFHLTARMVPISNCLFDAAPSSHSNVVVEYDGSGGDCFMFFYVLCNNGFKILLFLDGVRRLLVYSMK